MLLIISWKEQVAQNNFEKQLIKLRRNKRALWILVLFFAAVVMWIGVSLFSAQKKVAISQELRDLAKPLIPRLESKVFDELIKKRHFLEEEMAAFPIYIYDEETGSRIQLNEIPNEKELAEEFYDIETEGEGFEGNLENEQLLEEDFIPEEGISTSSANN